MAWLLEITSPTKPSCKTLPLVMPDGMRGLDAGEGWGWWLCCVVDFGVLEAAVLRQERRRGEMNLRKDVLGSAPPLHWATVQQEQTAHAFLIAHVLADM